MANNRMYLKCNVCGHAVCISSHLATPWQFNQHNMERMNVFMRDHFITCCKDYGMHSDDFSFMYEFCDTNPELEITDWTKVSHSDEIKWKHIEPPTEEEIAERERLMKLAAERRMAFCKEYNEKYRYGIDFEEVFNGKYIAKKGGKDEND